MRRDLNADMPWGMSHCWYQCDFVANAVIGFDKVHESCVKYGRYRIVKDALIKFGNVGALKIVVFIFGNEVSGVGECRHPFSIDEHGVPAHVIDMKVRAKHAIDGGRVEPCSGEVSQEGGL